VSEPVQQATDAAAAAPTCAQCSKTLAPGEGVSAGDREFCRSCYASLRAELEQAVTAQSSDINYVNAGLGALLGGGIGALAWWGFTAMTHWAIGLLAIAIGFLAGHGAVRFAGGKRSAGLQAVSITAALVSYFFATYLVNMTFINKGFADRGEAFRLGFPPNLEVLLGVVSANFGLMDLVFLAIAVYEAWKIPKPFALPPNAAA
jgi:hypothetical protein